MQLEIDSANRGGLVAFFEGTVVFIPFSRIPKEAGAIVTPEVCPRVLFTPVKLLLPKDRDRACGLLVLEGQRFARDVQLQRHGLGCRAELRSAQTQCFMLCAAIQL